MLVKSKWLFDKPLYLLLFTSLLNIYYLSTEAERKTWAIDYYEISYSCFDIKLLTSKMK